MKKTLSIAFVVLASSVYSYAALASERCMGPHGDLLEINTGGPIRPGVLRDFAMIDGTELPLVFPTTSAGPFSSDSVTADVTNLGDIKGQTHRFLANVKLTSATQNPIFPTADGRQSVSTSFKATCAEITIVPLALRGRTITGLAGQ
jgi:hypothetical protein